MLGKIEGKRRRGRQRVRWLDSVTDGHEIKQTPGDSRQQRNPCCCPWGRKESDTTLVTEQQSEHNLSIYLWWMMPWTLSPILCSLDMLMYDWLYNLSFFPLLLGPRSLVSHTFSVFSSQCTFLRTGIKKSRISKFGGQRATTHITKCLYLHMLFNELLFVHNYDMTRRRQWHPTPVLLPGKSHGWRSLVGCSPWGC